MQQNNDTHQPGIGCAQNNRPSRRRLRGADHQKSVMALKAEAARQGLT